MSVHRNIKYYRELRGWTQEDLARLAGIVRATLGKYETGPNKPDYNTLKKLANLLGVTIDTLLDNSLPIPDDAKAEFEFVELVKGYHASGLTKEQIKTMLDAALAIKKHDKTLQKKE
jgi:transcriptional regulator with XRE-family HTH domain